MAEVASVIGILKTGKAVHDFMKTITNQDLNMKVEWPNPPNKTIRMTYEETWAQWFGRQASRAAGVPDSPCPVYAEYADSPPNKFKVIEIVCNNIDFLTQFASRYHGDNYVDQKEVINYLKYQAQWYGKVSSIVTIFREYERCVIIDIGGMCSTPSCHIREYKLTYTLN
ncbi:unnamed protein product [Rotaria socialis]|uniref:Uncharacterized protein n=1 Tax=Rotaria socialis TaxID=392032 RepID=A0A818U4B9_9BILA|nr:unnamed protein product [Rotaria socialis]CAF3361828.1 unnamed protein product [Rotaria socialis]CAF3671062.1 unnamed protein product [Rotaria socialis]CAF3696036.1 unnamed protein product [Rotaria socialis]CAF4369097.1 unnamed protein product [Rotaria socialis]